MSDASDYLSQQMTLAASKPPIVTFVSCQRSLAPSGPPYTDGIGLATFGWGPNGIVHQDASGKPDGLHFGEVFQWFSDRTVVGQYPHDFPPEWQYFRAGSGPPAHDNREDLMLDFTLAKLTQFQVATGSGHDRHDLSGSRGSLREWVTGDTVVELTVVLWSWRTGTSVASAPTWTVSTSVVDGPSQQLVFNVPGSFKVPIEEGTPRGAPPAVMLVSFNSQPEWGWL